MKRETRLVLAAILCCVVVNASASVDAFKVPMGVHCLPEIEDGRWRQEGGHLDWHAKRCGVKVALGLGGSTNVSWLDWTVEYVNNGSYSGGGTFTSDENYRNGILTPHYHARYKGSSKAVVVTLDPTYRGSWYDVYARIGVQGYKAEIKFIDTDYDSPWVRNIIKHKDRGWDTYLGAGLRWKRKDYSITLDGYFVRENVPENPPRPGDFRRGAKIGIELNF